MGDIMATFSLCMIVKNEKDVLERCLNSAKDIFDEIIIVDTGSSDKTIEIAKKFTKDVYTFEWVDNFSKARNYSFSKATSDYIMWLDADDVILEKDKIKLLNLKQTITSNIDMVMMKYNISFDLNNNPTFSYYRERLLNRTQNYMWEGFIHEAIVPSGNIIYSDIAICHYKMKPNEPKRNLNIFNNMISSGKILNPREQFYYGRELYYNGDFKKAIMIFSNFLDSNEGWLENNINACIDLYNSYRKLNDDKNAIKSLLRSFEYASPRGEVCSELGNYYFSISNYNTAIYWYKSALLCTLKEEKRRIYYCRCLFLYTIYPTLRLLLQTWRYCRIY
jgi:glycosyltransferase involved in cell wall biosynthesis